MDLRIENIFHEEMMGDKSFNEKSGVMGFIFGERKWKQHEVREIWSSGIKYGIEIGLRRGSLGGQKIELEMSADTPPGKNREFLEKFYKLADEYECAIAYHPQMGMIVLDRKREI